MKPPLLKSIAEIERPGHSDIAGTVRYCQRAASEVYEACIAEGVPHLESAAAAGEAFRRTLPIVESRESAQALIACVAFGLAAGHINGETASKLAYVAQTALSAFRDGGTR